MPMIGAIVKSSMSAQLVAPGTGSRRSEELSEKPWGARRSVQAAKSCSRGRIRAQTAGGGHCRVMPAVVASARPRRAVDATHQIEASTNRDPGPTGLRLFRPSSA
jgi:hypothetical protein